MKTFFTFWSQISLVIAVISLYLPVANGVSVFAQEQPADMANIVLVGNVREALAKNDFVSARNSLETKSDEKLPAALNVFINVIEAQERLSASGGVSNKNGMQSYLDSTKTLSTDMRAIVAMESAETKDTFHANYTIAIAAITHFQCIEEYFSFAGGHFSNIPKATRDKIFDENLFAVKIFSESLDKCLAIEPNNPDSLLLQGVFQLKAGNERGITTINKSLETNTRDFYALVFAVKNWNNPLIVRNIDCLKKFVVVMRENRLKSINVLEIAQRKHSAEHKRLRDDFAASGATGFPSKLLLEMGNDSNLAKLNCEELLKAFNEELLAEEKK